MKSPVIPTERLEEMAKIYRAKPADLAQLGIAMLHLLTPIRANIERITVFYEDGRYIDFPLPMFVPRPT